MRAFGSWCLSAVRLSRSLFPHVVHPLFHFRRKGVGRRFYRFCPLNQKSVWREMSKLNSTMFDAVNRIDRSDVITFRCTLASELLCDAHRTFTGCYFPRWHALQLDEVREVLGAVKLFPALALDVYQNALTASHFLPADFAVGNRISVHELPQNQRDRVPKTYVIVECDRSRLRTDAHVGAHARGGVADAAASRVGAVSSPASAVILKIRDAYIRQAGGIPELGIKAFCRQFQRIAPDGKRVLSRQELRRAALYGGLSLPDDEVDQAFAAFSAGRPEADLGDVLDVVRGPMSAARKAAVREMFHYLDYDLDGQITTDEIAAKFAALDHEGVVQGQFTAEQILNGFMTTWDAKGKGGLVSFSEFSDYYSGVSATVESDDAFLQLLRSSWRRW